METTHAGSIDSGWIDIPRSVDSFYDSIFLDLDGVVIRGDSLVSNSLEVLNQLFLAKSAVGFVTNNASRTPNVIAESLSSLGVPTKESHVVTSAQAAATLLAKTIEEGSSVLVVGGEGLRQAVTERGYKATSVFDETVRAVVQGFSPDLSWPLLAEGCLAIRAGLPWFAANPDRTLPIERGIVPGNGAFVETLRVSTNLEPIYAGKPHPPLIEEALRRLPGRNALLIGDRLDTDISGARAGGIAGMFVLTGVHSVRDLFDAPLDQRPMLLGADLKAIFMPHRAPRRSLTGWCGGNIKDVRCEQVKGKWNVSVPPLAHDDQLVAVEATRVVSAVVWHLRDQGRSTSTAERELWEQLNPLLTPWGWNH
ncbi:MAG: HAD-IIA family hydrolase [Actinomycetota bacterium]